MTNKPNIISNNLDQVSKAWDFYEKELNSFGVNNQIIEAFDNYEQLFKLKENLLLNNTGARNLLVKLDVVIDKMAEKWLVADMDIIEKTIHRFVRYVKRLSEISKKFEDKYGYKWKVENMMSEIRSFAIPVAQKNGDSGWLVYLDGFGPGFNQFRSDDLEDVKKYKWKEVEIINFLLSEDWEKILLDQFGSSEKLENKTVICDQKCKWFKLIVDNQVLDNNGKRVYINFDYEFLDKLIG